VSKSLKDISIVAIDGEADASHCATLEPFALRVVGDSMAPEFLDGHLILLDPGAKPVHGAFVVVEIGGEVVFRQFWVEGECRQLRALRDEFPPIGMTKASRVVGVVTQRMGTRRRDRKYY
jgi:SOS-response transcriptional repressor LexA